MHAAGRSFALAVLVGLVLAATAWAVHPVAGAFYRWHAAGVGWKVSQDGSSMTFTGRKTVGLLCGSPKPPTGQSSAVVVLVTQNVPVLKIRSSGAFRGARTTHRNRISYRVVIAGHFTGNGKTMVFTVKTTGRCSSSKYTLHTR